MNAMRALCLLFILPLTLVAQSWLPAEATLREVPIYVAPVTTPHVELEMGYASSVIRNPELLQLLREGEVYQVDLVFTRYPRDFEDWQIDYQTLLEARYRSLHDLLPELFENEELAWRYILQTDCSTEAEAKALFHGFVLYTRPPDKAMQDVEAITFQNDSLRDSTAYRVLERHREWEHKLIVMDWTGSMYPYGASVLLWHRLNMQDSSVRHFVFFNDGNQTPDSEKKVGKTGGIFLSTTNDIDSVLHKMYEVMQKGDGGDEVENDVEALLRGTKKLHGYSEVVLIADNNSGIRDLSLAKYLGHPVRIILCGFNPRVGVHPDYLSLARITGGSIHTMDRDIEKLMEINEGQTIRINGILFRLKDGRFVRLGRS